MIFSIINLNFESGCLEKEEQNKDISGVKLKENLKLNLIKFESHCISGFLLEYECSSIL